MNRETIQNTINTIDRIDNISMLNKIVNNIAERYQRDHNAPFLILPRNNHRDIKTWLETIKKDYRS